jgi:dTDP-4-amino-4,6-dideoxygalactose transaminase
MRSIALFAPFGGQEEKDAVCRVLDGQWWGRGPEVAAFESEFAAYTGWKYCVTTNSATAALQIAVRCLSQSTALPRVKIGVPTMTFCSDAHAVAAEREQIVWLDCDRHGQPVLPEKDPGLYAAIAVHFGGRPLDLALWKKAMPGLRIIEDCAHSLGSDQKPQGWCAAYSFHAVKPLACGDGGALCTNDPELADRARRLAWLGIDRGTAERTTQAGYVPGYTINELGYKCHWNDLLASVGRVQLRRLPATTARRREIAERYHDGLAELEASHGIWRPAPCPGSSWHIYPVMVAMRDRVAAELRAAGIATGVHYQPLHRFPCYGTPGYCLNADNWAEHELSLPCHAGLTDADVDRVIEALTAIPGT